MKIFIISCKTLNLGFLLKGKEIRNLEVKISNKIISGLSLTRNVNKDQMGGVTQGFGFELLQRQPKD